MRIPYEVHIGVRYTRGGRARRRNAFISFISAVSMAGIALGVAALIVVLSVMNGFTKEVRDRMLSVLSHIEISSNAAHLSNWRAIAQKLEEHPEVVAAAPFVGAQAVIMQGDQVRGVAVRGILPEEEVKVVDAVTRLSGNGLGELADGALNIVLGIEIARVLGVSPGDKVALITPHRKDFRANSAPQLHQFRVVATLDSGHFQFDSTLALIHLEDARRLFRVDGPTGVRVRLTDMQRAPQLAAELARLIEPGLLVRDWSRQNRTWFAAVQVQKRMMFIIIVLIVAVAAFNLVSTLVMSVTEKQSEIAILRTLGASPASVMAVFIVQGGLIGAIGTVLGVAMGLLVSFNIGVIVASLERLFGVRFLDPSIYFIQALPSDPRVADVISIAMISLTLALLATLYPSWRASRVRPAEALRYD